MGAQPGYCCIRIDLTHKCNNPHYSRVSNDSSVRNATRRSADIKPAVTAKGL